MLTVKKKSLVDLSGVSYSLKGLGEDYEGFKTALRASEEIDKSDQDMLIRIAETESDEKRKRY